MVGWHGTISGMGADVPGTWVSQESWTLMISNTGPKTVFRFQWFLLAHSWVASSLSTRGQTVCVHPASSCDPIELSFPSCPATSALIGSRKRTMTLYVIWLLSSCGFLYPKWKGTWENTVKGMKIKTYHIRVWEIWANLVPGVNL